MKRLISLLLTLMLALTSVWSVSLAETDDFTAANTDQPDAAIAEDTAAADPDEEPPAINEPEPVRSEEEDSAPVEQETASAVVDEPSETAEPIEITPAPVTEEAGVPEDPAADDQPETEEVAPETSAIVEETNEAIEEHQEDEIPAEQPADEPEEEPAEQETETHPSGEMDNTADSIDEDAEEPTEGIDELTDGETAKEDAFIARYVALSSGTHIYANQWLNEEVGTLAASAIAVQIDELADLNVAVIWLYEANGVSVRYVSSGSVSARDESYVIAAVSGTDATVYGGWILQRAAYVAEEIPAVADEEADSEELTPAQTEPSENDDSVEISDAAIEETIAALNEEIDNLGILAESAEPKAVTVSASASGDGIMLFVYGAGSDYSIYRSEAYGDYMLITPGFSTSTYAVDYDVIPGRRYRYRIVSSSGLSGYSSYLSAGTTYVTNIRANANGEDKITVTWNLYPNANSYSIYRSTTRPSSDGSVSGMTYVATVDQNESQRYFSYADSGLEPSTTYYYRILADGKTTSSMLDSATTDEKYYPPFVEPAVVTGVKGKPVDTNASRVTWDSMSDITGYQLWRATSENGDYTWIKNNPTPAVNNYSLTPGQDYWYKVRAYVENANGDRLYGEFSESVHVHILGKIENFTVVGKDTNCAMLRWDKVAGTTGYQVFRTVAGSGEYTWVKNATTAQVANYSLTPDTQYYYKLRAYIDLPDGTRAYGQFSEGKPVYIMGQAEITSISYNGNIVLKWDSLTHITGYQIFYKQVGVGDDYSWKTNVGSGVTTYTHSGLPEGKDYYYKIRSYREEPDGTRSYGQYSEAVHHVTRVGTPVMQDAYGKITNAHLGLHLVWSDIPGVNNYEIQYSTSYSSGYKTLASIYENNPGDYSSVYYDTTEEVIEAGKLYYLRVRAVLKNGGKTYYSNWSTPMSGSIPKVLATDVTTVGYRYSVVVQIANLGDLTLTVDSSKYSGYCKPYGTGSSSGYLMNLHLGGTIGPNSVGNTYYEFATTSSSVYVSSSSTILIHFYYNGYRYSMVANREGAIIFICDKDQ